MSSSSDCPGAYAATAGRYPGLGSTVGEVRVLTTTGTADAALDYTFSVQASAGSEFPVAINVVLTAAVSATDSAGEASAVVSNPDAPGTPPPLSITTTAGQSTDFVLLEVAGEATEFQVSLSSFCGSNCSGRARAAFDVTLTPS